MPILGWRGLGEEGVLLRSEGVDGGVGERGDILVGDGMVYGGVFDEGCIFGEANGEEVMFLDGLGIFTDAVAGEASDGIEFIAFSEGFFSDGNDIDDGSSDWRNGRVV